MRDYDRRVELAIETKHPTRFAGLVERRLVELLDRYGWARPRRGTTSPARVMSFSWMSLRRTLELAPTLETVYLMDRVPLRFRDGSLPLGASVAGPSIEIIRAHPEYVAKAHRAGNQVHVWTVNNAVDVELCAALGVDAVITDKPGKTLRQLQERATSSPDTKGVGLRSLVTATLSFSHTDESRVNNRLGSGSTRKSSWASRLVTRPAAAHLVVADTRRDGVGEALGGEASRIQPGEVAAHRVTEPEAGGDLTDGLLACRRVAERLGQELHEVEDLDVTVAQGLGKAVVLILGATDPGNAVEEQAVVVARCRVGRKDRDGAA